MSLELSMWLFGACGAGILMVLGFAWHCHGKMSEESARLRSDLNTLREDTATAIGKVREEHYQYKVHVAEHFATITLTTAVERRVGDQLEEIKKSLTAQSLKIDRLFEDGHGGRGK